MPNTLTNVIIDAYSGYDTIVSRGNDGYIEGGAGKNVTERGQRSNYNGLVVARYYAKDTKLATLNCDGNVITTSEAVSDSSEYWFTDDLNFVESYDNLDAISEVTEDGYAVDKISDTGVGSLTPIEILTSYSDK